MLQKTFLNSKSLQPLSKTAKTREQLAQRLAIIEKILEHLHLDLRIQPLDAKLLTKTASSWNLHYDRAGIPTNRLFDVYLEAMANKDENSMFAPTVMVQTWRKMQLNETEKARSNASNDVCPLCKNTGKVMDFDKEVSCPYKHPINND